MIRFLRWIAKKLHRHEWEVIGELGHHDIARLPTTDVVEWCRKCDRYRRVRKLG
jgi:hypothetical protein